MANQGAIVRRVAEEVFKEKGMKVEYMVGTMIELPRAALVADEIAKEAEFFSFGTNDLTQTTFGFSRDDVNKVLPTYLAEGILKQDPFAALDQEGVGQLVKMATERGRKTRSNLKVGICGEHGGEPSSVEFCYQDRTELRFVLTVPRADRAAGGGAGCGGREVEGRGRKNEVNQRKRIDLRLEHPNQMLKPFVFWEDRFRARSRVSDAGKRIVWHRDRQTDVLRAKVDLHESCAHTLLASLRFSPLPVSSARRRPRRTTETIAA